MSLADDVAELFAGLDGYDDYWHTVAARRSASVDYQRRYNRENADKRRNYSASYARKRRNDPAMGEKLRAYQREWGRKRRKKPYGPVSKHGTTNGYFTQGCRCDRCKSAVAAYARELYARRKARAA